MSIDPTLRFPIEIVEEIFHHMSGFELIKCTFVSKSCNAIIGSSPRIMDKVVIFIGNRSTNQIYCFNKRTNFVVTDVEGSTRRYQNIHICAATELLDFLFNFVKGKSWKHVKFHDTEFLSTSNLSKFVEIFEKTVTELDLCYISYKTTDEPLKRFD
jgi:F-box domain